MSIPPNVIDRIFQRMAATYGAAWDRHIGLAPICDVKSAWAHELQGFGGHIEAIAWALENLPETVPNVIQFRNLARRAPLPDLQRLPEPKPDPRRVAEELAKLGGLREKIAAAPLHRNIEWAHRIVGRANDGARVAPLVLKIAQDALGRRGASL
jgi:hypothetical protein